MLLYDRTSEFNLLSNIPGVAVGTVSGVAGTPHVQCSGRTPVNFWTALGASHPTSLVPRTVTKAKGGDWEPKR